VRKRILVSGTVQGVGFRPFVFNLARNLSLCGFVQNTAKGVVIEAEGEGLDRFIEHLRTRAPVLARIESIDTSDIAPGRDSDFKIVESSARTDELVFVPPDIGTCDECLRDCTDPANRRFEYAFTNCTNCGPRYSIIQDVPYDRPFTTMSAFRMCELCEAEYHDPANRRFHAQPNACPVCGPHLSADIGDIRSWLREGLIVAVKGIGGYHLACDANNALAVVRLRERKRRNDKPFAVMVPDLAAAERLCLLTDSDRESLRSPRRPIVIVPKQTGNHLPEALAPGNRNLGIFLPYTPLHYLLFATGEFEAVVMTSGNLSEEPIVSREDDLPRLESIVDRCVTHNRPIETRVDDSVVRVFRGRERVLRRSRGYAPASIDLGATVQPILAVGGELKNAFCLTKDRYAIFSQHIGDLENYETLECFRETLAHMSRFFRIEPKIVAHDMHPNYLSTRFALELESLVHVPVQHHHAHIVACMAENRIEGPVTGVAFDGTGYGTDGQVWGGEILVCDAAGFDRRFHLRYVPMVGGDAAIRQPWRMAISYLRDTFGEAVPELPHLQGRRLPPGLPTINTSSAGRLFDAVASILGVRMECTFEAQAAIELESLAGDGRARPYGFDIADGEIDFRETIRQIVADPSPAPVRSARFHNTVAGAIVEVCRRVGLKDVCLSGGTFQNMRLLDAAVRGLEASGFRVHLHAEVPPNDGGLALGQAVVANARAAEFMQ
jgi:hydrogenase maturation protein HypF